MKPATLPELKRFAAAALCLIIAGVALLALASIGRWPSPLVHSPTQAFFLGCDDSVRPDIACHPYRVGGTIVAAPMRGSPGSNADFEFALTDNCLDWPVSFHGDAAAAARLRAGAFAVARGATSIDGNFHSATIFTSADAARLRGEMRPTEDAMKREACPHGRAGE